MNILQLFPSLSTPSSIYRADRVPLFFSGNTWVSIPPGRTLPLNMLLSQVPVKGIIRIPAEKLSKARVSPS